MACIFYFALCMNVVFNSLRHRKIKSIHAIFITHYFYILFIRDFNWNYFVMRRQTGVSSTAYWVMTQAF